MSKKDVLFALYLFMLNNKKKYSRSMLSDLKSSVLRHLEYSFSDVKFMRDLLRDAIVAEPDYYKCIVSFNKFLCLVKSFDD